MYSIVEFQITKKKKKYPKPKNILKLSRERGHIQRNQNQDDNLFKQNWMLEDSVMS